METELIYWRHHTPVGIKIEEISGADNRKMGLWLELARQLYCEKGKGEYRSLMHFDSGAPYLGGELTRISISHTDHFMVVASLPKTPEAVMSEFSERAALGVDVEKWSRSQVFNVRDRFLSARELEMIPANDLRANIIAWTAKEALYKASLSTGLDFREDIAIQSLPKVSDPVIMAAGEVEGSLGKAVVTISSGRKVSMSLYCYSSEDCCVMIAFSPKCAKYKS